MARIVIEINDLVSDKIDAKINQIDVASKNANESVKLLSKSLKELDKSALGGIAQVIRDVTASQKALNSALQAGERSLQGLRNQTLKTSQSQEIFNERLRTQALKSQVVEERLKQAEIRTERLGAASNKASRSIFNLTNIFRVLALIRVSEQAIQLVDSYTLMENRIKLVARSSENLIGIQSELFRIANTSRVPIVELTQSYVRYDYALRELGATQRESLRFTETLSKQLAIGGLATQEQSSALLQLSQALNKGKLDGDEFRTIMETLPTLATAIAKEMGVARGELIKLAPQGKITSDIIRKAMASIAEETDKAFSKLTPTISQSLTVAKNNIIQTIGELNKLTGFSESIAKGILFISENLKILAVGFIAVGSAILTSYIPAIIAATERTGLFLLTFAANPYVLAIGGITALTSAIIIYKDEVNLAHNQSVTFGDSLKAFEQIMPSFKDGLVALTKDAFPLFSKSVEHSGDVLNNMLDNIFNKDAYISGLQTIIVDTGLSFVALSDAIGTTEGEFDNFITTQENIANERERILKLQKESIDLLNKERQAVRDTIDLNKLLSDSYKLLDPKSKGTDTSKEGIELAVKKSEDEYRSRIVLLEAYLSKDENIRSQHAQLIYDLEIESIQKSAQIRNPEGYKEKLRLEQEEINVLNSVKREINEYATKQSVLNSLISKGSITQDQYNEELNKTSLMLKKIKIEQETKTKAGKDDFTSQLIKSYDETEERIATLTKNKKEFFKTDIEYLNEVKRVRDFGAKEEEEIDKRRETYNQERLDAIDKISNASEQAAIKAGKTFDEQEKKRALAILKTLEDTKNQSLALDLASNRINKSLGENDAPGARAELAKKDANDRLEADLAKNANALEEAKVARAKATANQIADIDRKLYEERAQLAANLFGTLSGLAEKFVQGHGKRAKIAFEVSKGLAYAEAVLNMASAISKANATTGLYDKAVAIAQAVAVGANAIASIKQAEAPKFAKGSVNIGGSGTSTSDSMLAYISRGESVMNARATRTYRATLDYMNNNPEGTASINNTYMSGNQGGAKTNIIINNNHNGAQVEARDDGNGNIEIMVEQIDAHLAKKYADGNGKLAKAIDGKRLRNF